MSSPYAPRTTETEPAASTPVKSTHLETDARNRALFEHSPDGVLVADLQGRYVDANPGICRMLGYTRDELVGMRSSDIVAADQAKPITPALEGNYSASAYQCEWTFCRKDGTTFGADVLATPLPDGNLLAVVRDVSGSRRAHEYREHLAALVESSGDAIIGKDLDGIITSWNGGAEIIFGYPANAAIGMSIRRLIPDDRQHEEDAILARLRSGERVEHFETRRCTRDGRIIDVSVTASPIRDAGGRVIGASKIARNITEQKAQEHELRRITRLYAALSQVNQAIVWTNNRDELLPKVCQVLIQFGGFKMAWIGWHDPSTGRLIPVAESGDKHGYLRTIEIRVDDPVDGGRPAVAAFGSLAPHISNDVLEDSSMQPWRAALVRSGFRAAAAFPIRMHGAVCATLYVYSDETGFFQKEEIALLEEAAGDVSFALDNFARIEELRSTSEIQSRLATIVDTSDDAIIGMTLDGSITSWNCSAELMFGYTADEAIGHPMLVLVPPEHIAEELDILKRLALGESVRNFETARVRKDGTLVVISATHSPITDAAGNVIGASKIARDITRQKLAEEALCQSEASLAHAQRIAQLGNWEWNILTDALSCSAQIFELFGMAPGDVASNYEAFLQGVHPEDREWTHQAVQDAVAGVAAYSLDHRVLWPDGTLRWMHAQGEVTRDAEGRALKMTGTMQDISEHVEAESRLRESEERFRTMANSMSQLAWIAQPDGYIYWYNQRWYEYTGATPEAMEGWGWQSVHDPQLVDNVVQRWSAAIEAGETFEMEFPLRSADGHMRMFLTRAVPLKRADGQIVQWFGTNTDVHDLKEAEENVRQVNADLERRVIERTAQLEAANHDLAAHAGVISQHLRAAEAADRVKSAFLATMSHELRTPLNSIIGLTGVLLQRLPGPLNSEQAKQLGMVSNSADHLLELINDVLDISRIEAGQLAIHEKSFELREAIEQAMTTVGPLAVKKGLALNLVVETPLGTMVSDRRRLLQILINLLGNAIKFTQRGSVTLSVACLQVPDASPGEASGSIVRFQVIDTGIGMHPDELAKLFKPFQQLDSGLSRHHEGTGLGLAISSRLCELLGGRITVISQRGQGSTFTVSLQQDGTIRA